MTAYIVRRVLAMVPTIIVVTVAVASLMRVVPGDPAVLALGQAATDQDLERFRQAYHLDDPFPVQYLAWWRDVATGNLGSSVVHRSDVVSELKDRLPTTLELLVLSVAMSTLVGIPAGVFSAIYRRSRLDYGIRFVAIAGLSIPAFWLGTLALVLPGAWWGYLPPIGRVHFFDDPLKNLEQYSIPAATLAVSGAAGIMRLTRSSVLEVLRQDYVRTATAKGLRGRTVVVRHVLRNSLIPVITVIGLQVAHLFGGAIIAETIFNIPGVGLLLISSMQARDYPVIQGLVLFLAVVFLTVNLLVDLSYVVLDPRVRY